MDHACKNCTNDIEQNFCSHCGQKKYKRIDRKYLIDEIQYIAIHTNKGFFYSIKKILKNPGQTARDFIEGNRVNHYKPIYLAFLLCGISTFISVKIIGFNDIMLAEYQQQGLDINRSNKIFAIMTDYLAIINLLMVPFFAVFSLVAFRKWGQNYFEHVVMNSFFLSYYTLIYIILYPLLYIFRENHSVFIWLTFGLMLIIPFLSIWFYKGFYTDKKISSIILRVGFIFLQSFLAYIALLLFILIIGVAIKLITH